MIDAPLPICRCPHCGARWLTQRALHTEELLTVALVCVACSRDFELIDGALVAIGRPATEAAPWPTPSLPVYTGEQRGRGRPRKVEATG